MREYYVSIMQPHLRWQHRATMKEVCQNKYAVRWHTHQNRLTTTNASMGRTVSVRSTIDQQHNAKALRTQTRIPVVWSVWGPRTPKRSSAQNVRPKIYRERSRGVCPRIPSLRHSEAKFYFVKRASGCGPRRQDQCFTVTLSKSSR